MTPEKWIKFVSWVGMVILLPAASYPIGLLLAGMDNKTVTLKDAIELGDVLLLVITLLGVAVDVILMSLIVHPKKEITKSQVLDYASFFFAFLSVIVIAALYGRIVMGRLSGGPPIQDLKVLARIYITCYLFYALFSAAVFFRLLRSGRLA